MSIHLSSRPRNKAVTDHTGAHFPSLRACADFWGVTYTTMCKNLKAGMTLEDAISRGRANRAEEQRRRECETLSKSARYTSKFVKPGRVFARLSSWGISQSHALEIAELIQLPKSKIATNHGSITAAFENGHICPRCGMDAANARWLFGFTVKECALSSRAFSRLVLERFHV